jgi:hypothetical protein
MSDKDRRKKDGQDTNKKNQRMHEAVEARGGGDQSKDEAGETPKTGFGQGDKDTRKPKAPNKG